MELELLTFAASPVLVTLSVRKSIESCASDFNANAPLWGELLHVLGCQPMLRCFVSYHTCDEDLTNVSGQI